MPVSRFRIALAALLAGLLSVVWTLRAEDVQAEDFFHTTATSIVEWHTDNRDPVESNDDFLDIINKVNLSFKSGIVQTDLRVDTFTILSTDPFGEKTDSPPRKGVLGRLSRGEAHGDPQARGGAQAHLR